MREEFRRESDMRSAGLTTADLANLDEHDLDESKLDEQKTTSRSDVVRDKGLDKATAELEARQVDFHALDEDSKLGESRVERSAIQSGPVSSGPVPVVAPVAVEDENRTAPLFSSSEADEFHDRWNAVQVGFVDEPRQAVQEADSLVAGAMKRLAEIFAEERARLDGQWDRGGDVSTEDLRIALRRYRSFFGRLLSV
jgi:hypothetical protein